MTLTKSVSWVLLGAIFLLCAMVVRLTRLESISLQDIAARIGEKLIFVRDTYDATSSAQASVYRLSDGMKHALPRVDGQAFLGPTGLLTWTTSTLLLITPQKVDSKSIIGLPGTPKSIEASSSGFLFLIRGETASSTRFACIAAIPTKEIGKECDALPSKIATSSEQILGWYQGKDHTLLLHGTSTYTYEAVSGKVEFLDEQAGKDAREAFVRKNTAQELPNIYRFWRLLLIPTKRPVILWTPSNSKIIPLSKDAFLLAESAVFRLVHLPTHAQAVLTSDLLDRDTREIISSETFSQKR